MSDTRLAAPRSSDAQPATGGGRILRVLREEFGGWSPRLAFVGALARLLPFGGFGRVRARLLSLAGAQVGRGAILEGFPTFSPGSRGANLRVGPRCFLNGFVHIDAAGAAVTLGEGVSIGHHALLITTDHSVGPPAFRAGDAKPAPITVGDGAWIAAGAVILPGVTVGAGAVVAAGAVVTRDVPAHTLVGGVPAKPLRTLPTAG